MPLGIAFQSDKTLQEYRELAELVARYDFETASIYQDLFYQPPWPGLLQFAERTRRPLVGPAALNPYLTHPLVAAGNLAVLDQASGGRAYLGVVRGAFFESIGVAQPRPLRAMREMVELVQRFLRGDRTPYEGDIFRASKDAYLRFPVPGRDLPVMLGGWGPKVARLAGEIADMFKVGGSANAEAAPLVRRWLDEGATSAGRLRPKLVFGAVTVVDRDRATAERIARREVAMYVAVTSRMDPVYRLPAEELTEFDDAMSSGDPERAGEALSLTTLRRFSCFGTPEDIAEHLKEMFDAGVDLFELGTPHGANEVEAVRLLGEAVLPLLA